MKKSIAIIGGGPSALMLAATLDKNIFDVTLYERNAATGRKFLVAGDGGLNITHSEPLDLLITRYLPSSLLKNPLHTFSNTDLQNWLQKLGIETFEGTSKRVFPLKGTKPITVLNTILDAVRENGTEIKTRYLWMGWGKDKDLLFYHDDSPVSIKADIYIFALGGGSWKKTGSDGTWMQLFEKQNIQINAFQSSNCACLIDWEKEFITKFEGRPMKNLAVSCLDTQKKGEVLLTRQGLEGSAIYALLPQIRSQLNTANNAIIHLDLKPTLTTDQIVNKLNLKAGISITRILKEEIRLSNAAIGLLKSLLTKDEYLSNKALSILIKKLPLNINGLAPIDEAISTIGGISLNEIDDNFQLKKRPNHYVIGEMLDWDAPTGGYLLQGCFSMGYFLAKQLNSSVTL